MSEHSDAITYDLLTKTHFTLEDVGSRLSWSALHAFIKNLDTDSALARDMNKSTGWENTLTTNQILADIYDMLQAINANLVMVGGGKHKKIKPYPRPNRKGIEKERKIGKGALPFDKLREWIKERQNGEERI